MAAKLLHSLADDNPDLQRQIGCMTGIFQLFDRHHIVAPRRISHKRPPSGNPCFNDGRLERDSSADHHQQTETDMSLNKGVNERQRISTESSRASFSSCSSSPSSLDCKAEPEAAFDTIVFPETPSRDTVMSETTICPHLWHNSLDLRDVVKDSMYREARGMWVKATAKEEASIHTMSHKDSPRPLQLSKSVDGSYGVGIDEKQSLPIDLQESIRALTKLREAPWHYAETRENPRPSHELKDGHWHSISKDAPWFSYDGREISRLSFESCDMIKSMPKIKELPRQSLDSREGPWRGYSIDSKRLSRKVYSSSSTSNDKASSPQQSSTIQSRPPSVVAKLMGLEALPDSSLHGYTHSSLTETYSAQDNGQFPRSSKIGFTRPLHVCHSPKISLKDPSSPRRKNPDMVMKPISSSRVPIEPAPWKQQDVNRSSQKPSSMVIKAPTRSPDSFSSVYSEIEKRLKHLEFKQSGRDLRALKQILEAMQEKRLLDNRKEQQAPNVSGSQRDYEPNVTNLIQNSTSVRQQNPEGNNLLSSTIKGSYASAFESPIVIMKPAKLVEKTRIPASSVIPNGGLSSSHKLQSGGVYVDNKNGTSSTREAKDQFPKVSHHDTSVSSIDKKASSGKTMMRPAQSQPRSQQLPKENSPSSVKHSGSMSPRLQQKKLDLEKQSRPPALSSASNKTRRQPGKKASESGSSGGNGKQRPKFPNLQRSDEQLSEISNESRSLSCQGNEVSLQSESTSVNLMTDIEITSSLRSAEVDDSRSPSLKAMKQLVSRTVQKKSTPRLDEDETIVELATVSPEHPSTISVLDGSVYRDDAPSISEDPKDVGFIHQSHYKINFGTAAEDAQESKGNKNKDRWNAADNLSFNSAASGEINRKKLQSIDHLVQKLRRLNSSHDEARTDYVASLCESTNPDHRYISEILLASGLLLRDLSSELLTFQLHSSGQPINPELFLVLEQTKASSLHSEDESSNRKVAYLKLNVEKFHRKLLFDAVNEILGAKFGSYPKPWFQHNRIRLAKKTLGAQKLLKELCFEIEKIQAKKIHCDLEDEDGLKSMLWEDVMHGSESWTEFHGDSPGVVLDVERLVFKDLVNEIVIGEAAGLRVKSSMVRRRKQFGK